LIWSEIAIFFGGTLSNALFAEGLQKFVLMTTVVGAVINVALNLVLIPRWGAMGASWATVIAYGLSWTAAFLPFRPTRATLWVGLRLLVPIVAVSLLVFGGAILLPVNDWVRLGAAIPLFVLLSFVFKFVRNQDLEFLRNLWRSRMGARDAETQA